MLDPQDAQLIVAQVVGAEAAREGRDFIYTFTKQDGTSVTGRVVDHKGPHLELLVEDAHGGRARKIGWDEIAAIQITGE